MNLMEHVDSVMLPISLYISFMREYDRALAIWEESMSDEQKSIYLDFYDFLEVRIRNEILEKAHLEALKDLVKE